jgi:hypothetical protein
MKALFIFCSACCFIALLNLPIVYYTLLRVIISLGSILVIYAFLKYKNYSWIVVFAIILILFNPIFPIYLHRKSIWMPLDVIVGILFLLIAFLKKEKRIEEEKIDSQSRGKTYTRDRIILPKNLTKKEN